MPIGLILQFLIALPGIIKAIMEIIEKIRGMDDGDEKEKATREFEDIKQTIVERKGLGRAERDRIRNLRDRLKRQ